MKYIAYYRVSTRKQGESGLGLEAQRATVANYVKSVGGESAGEFVEVESGKRADRPQLARAIATAKRQGAVLVIAKLDRLSRNVAFLAALMDSGVDFVAVDMPSASRFMLHVMIAFAEEEARKISERTTAALAAAKARGTLLGSARPGHWQGREDARRLGAGRGAEVSAEVRTAKAMAAVADLIPEMQARRQSGESLGAIAAALNSAGQKTARGAEWTAMQVKRALDRAAETR